MEESRVKTTGRVAAWEIAALALCLGFLIGHSIYSARMNSVTVDEYVHLPVSLSILQTGKLDMDHPGSPPLRAVAAIPALYAHPVTDYESEFWKNSIVYSFSWKFMADNVAGYHELYFGPRMVITGFAALLGLLVFAAARSIAGPAGAALAIFLFAFNPEILAHAALMTVDIPVTCFFFAAVFFFIRFTKGPGLFNTLGMGVCTGLAMLAKFSALALPVLLLIALLIFIFTSEFRSSRFRWTRYACGYAAAMIIAIIVLNAGYRFADTGAALSAVEWKSAAFKTLAGSWAGWIPVPLPHYYLDALDIQIFNKNRGAFVYFLNGELSREGWASYYWVALALKTPVPLLLACAAALAGGFRRTAAFAERVLWLAPAMFMFAATFTMRIDMGFRYMLPMIPCLIILAAGALARLASRSRSGASIVAALCAWCAMSGVTALGNQLSYFNEFAGGPDGGHRYLVESNLDWGQNLVRLKKYTEKNSAQPLLLYNYGLNTSSAYRIKAGWVPCKDTPAVVAISVNYLAGIDPFEKRSAECFSWLKKYEPVEKIGGGLFIYDTR